MGEKYLVLNGTKFISSRRASEVSGYTLDYIGQLARAEKIHSKMIGRARFIDEFSLEQYLLHSSVNGGSKGPIVTVFGDPIEVTTLKNKKHKIESISSIRDHDIVFKNKARNSWSIFNQFRFTTVICAILGLIFFLNSPFGRVGLRSLMAPLDGLTDLAIEISNPNQTGTLAESVVITGREADRIYLGFLHRVDLAVLGTARGLRQVILDWFERGTNYLAKIQKREMVIEERTVTTESTDETLAVERGLSEEEIRKLVNELVREELAAHAKDETIRGSGLVVVPATGDSACDELIKQRVANSFSDEVEITLDPSKTTGVLRPVFRNRVGEDFLFMLVPVNEE